MKRELVNASLSRSQNGYSYVKLAYGLSLSKIREKFRPYFKLKTLCARPIQREIQTKKKSKVNDKPEFKVSKL